MLLAEQRSGAFGTACSLVLRPVVTLRSKLVDERDLGEAIGFTGEVREPAPYLEVMDLFAMTRPLEASGITVIERAIGARVASWVGR